MKKVAYLLSQYPAVSHTFFFNEVLALRREGFRIKTASINSTVAPADGFSGLELAEQQSTFYVKEQSFVAIAKALFLATRMQPMMWVRGLREVVRLAPGDIFATGYALFYLIEAVLVGSWMQRENCDHLHVHFSGPAATVALLVSVTWQFSYSMTVHGPDELFNIEKNNLTKKVTAALFVTCISNFCRSQILRVLSMDSWDKVHVCRLGVDPELFEPLPGRGTDPLRLVSVGRLHPSKGQAVLLRAVQQLRDRGCDFHLDLVGGGLLKPQLDSLIEELGLRDHVTLHGAMSHSRTRVIVQQADLFLLPSFAEGVPVALMEAMSMEIACVSTFVAGVPELIESGKEGILVAPSSVDGLSEAIVGLISDPARRTALAEAGRRKVLENYNLADNIRILAATFREHLS